MAKPRALDTYTIREEWREAVRVRMRELDIGVVELARRINATGANTVTHGTINHMLSTTKTSEHVPSVHRVLGWPPPHTSEDSLDEDEMIAEIRDGWDRLSQKDKEWLLDSFRRVLPPG